MGLSVKEHKVQNVVFVCLFLSLFLEEGPMVLGDSNDQPRRGYGWDF